MEEHSVIGGLGSAVCDCLCANHPVPVKKVGMQDVFGESGSAAALVEKYGLDAKGLFTSLSKNFVREYKISRGSRQLCENRDWRLLLRRGIMNSK